VSEPLLRTEGLTRHFRVGKLFSRQRLHAVDDVSFEIGRGEIVALVGESGSGKSTIARLLARVCKATAGDIYFEGKRVSTLRTRRQRLGYAGDVAMVFQDPYSAGSFSTVATWRAAGARTRSRRRSGRSDWFRPGASPESSRTS